MTDKEIEQLDQPYVIDPKMRWKKLPDTTDKAYYSRTIIGLFYATYSLDHGNWRSTYQFDPDWDEHSPHLVAARLRCEMKFRKVIAAAALRPTGKPPEDDGKPLGKDWVLYVLPATSRHGRIGRHHGKLGQISWSIDRSDPDAHFIVWLNGAIYDWEDSTRGQFRQLCQSLGITLKE